MATRDETVLIVGVGNQHRGDDGVGLAVARQLGTRGDTVVIQCDGEPARLVASLAGATRAYIVDAADFGAAPGTILRMEAGAGPMPAVPGTVSTHGLGLAESLDLARALGQLPQRCVIYAIQGLDFAPGVGLSAAVATAADEVAERIREELAGPQDRCTKQAS
jgi:hydrogenase maturation protease